MSSNPGSRKTVPSVDIHGCLFLELESHPDARGSFGELFRSSWFVGSFAGDTQLNLTSTRKGALRGLHFHRRQHDFWVLLEGRIRAGLVDLRKGSPTRMVSGLVEIDASSGPSRGLLIPPGVAHGYLSLEYSRLLYVVDRLYDGTDEFGVAWDDPGNGLDWGIDDPVLSGRDMANPRVEQLSPGDLVEFEASALSG